MSICPLEEQEVRYQISQIKELPPLPQSVQRLIEIIQDEIDSAEELESIIGYDQAVAAKVLQIANSTYYGFRRTVTSIARAIAVVGFNQVKSICLCTLLINLMSDGRKIDPVHRERLWKHAFATSRIAAAICKKRPWVKREEAALLGLIHDIGHLAMATYFSEYFQYVMDTAARRNSSPWCVEMQAGLSHTEVGKYLASRWALPESFQAVIEFHHCPERCDSHRSEIRLIHLADVLSSSPYYPHLLTDEATLSYCRDLFISEDEWQEYQDSLEFIWQEVDQLWGLLK
ncbi:MAG: HDOD domain-containing protein [Syntrophobacteraceae bacterium]